MLEISQRLNEFFDKYLPIADHIGMRVDDYDGKSLTLYAPLKPNINDKQTAFGGSLYCLCVTSSWGMTYLKSLEHNIETPNIMVTNANIRYLLPVDSCIRSTCLCPQDSSFDTFFTYYEEKGTATITLHSTITVNNKEAVLCEAEYMIRR